MYNVNEPQMTRDQLMYTSTLAELGGVAGAKVVPYVALGAGWFRNSSTPHTEHICDDAFPPPNPSPGWGRRRQLQVSTHGTRPSTFPVTGPTADRRGSNCN